MTGQHLRRCFAVVEIGLDAERLYDLLLKLCTEGINGALLLPMVTCLMIFISPTSSLTERPLQVHVA
jgi:hypothetical protein